MFCKNYRGSARLLHREFKLGMNFYFNADLYGYNLSEKLFGLALRPA